MAFFIQYRNLCKRVKQQLSELDDKEKSQSTVASPRLSGDTQQAGEDGGNHDKTASEDDLKKFPYAALDGISVEEADGGEKYYQVNWESASDPQNPHNWSRKGRIRVIFLIIGVAFVVTCSSSIDSANAPQAAKEFGVSDVVEALGGTGIFLIGFGIGALLASPASEMVGRYPVYVGTLMIFGCWLIGAALSPNIGAQIAFRFLAGLFGSAPLTVAGGSISDMFNPKEKTWAFPMFAIVGFGGPVLGPVIASYIGFTKVLSWRWSEWVMLIADGLKALHLRKLTGDDRFKTAAEAQGFSVGEVLKRNFTRPFILAVEPIVFCFTLYLTVIYIVLFTFLDGYPYIFERTYGINQGLSNLCFLGLLVGIMLSMTLVPLVYHITKKQLARDGDDGTGKVINQEMRLIFAMIEGPLMPVGLLWMAWTDYAWISIWSPIMASVLIGFSIILIFLSAYMYVIDSYEVYAASALTFVALIRYLVAGGMTVVGVPFYSNMGPHWTLTILGGISAVVAPIPFILYIWGHKLRAKSKYAVGQE